MPQRLTPSRGVLLALDTAHTQAMWVPLTFSTPVLRASTSNG